MEEKKTLHYQFSHEDCRGSAEGIRSYKLTLYLATHYDFGRGPYIDYRKLFSITCQANADSERVTPTRRSISCGYAWCCEYLRIGDSYYGTEFKDALKQLKAIGAAIEGTPPRIQLSSLYPLNPKKKEERTPIRRIVRYLKSKKATRVWWNREKMGMTTERPATLGRLQSSLTAVMS